MIAVLGLGLLGAGFAENLIAKGERVRVWNRSAEKAAPLVALGAEQAETPADAVRGATRVHLILAADQAVESVIEALLPGLGDGVALIDHSTTQPALTAARTVALRAKGVRYLHMPVFMGPANAKSASGLMLSCGPEAEVEALRPVLSQMTGKLMYLGEKVDAAATLKIVGNGLLISLSATMGDLFRVAAGGGVSAEAVLELFRTFQPGPGYIGSRVLQAGTGPASFELTMARKDVRLMIETGGPGLTVLPAIAARMDEALAEGLGAEDYAIFAKP